MNTLSETNGPCPTFSTETKLQRRQLTLFQHFLYVTSQVDKTMVKKTLQQNIDSIENSSTAVKQPDPNHRFYKGQGTRSKVIRNKNQLTLLRSGLQLKSETAAECLVTTPT